MPPPERPRIPTGTANLAWVITDDGSRTLFDSGLNETFHSGCGAVAETLIVYLLNSGVAERLRAGHVTAVLEYGLGTATGFLLTAALAEFHRAPLYYEALECSLLPNEVFQALDLVASVERCLLNESARTDDYDPEFTVDEFRCLPELSKTFCSQISPLTGAPLPLRVLLRISEFVELSLVLGDARESIAFTGVAPETRVFDAIYFDPFSPETNPEMWVQPIFEQAALVLKTGGTLTSYCVNSSVRRLVASSGLQVKKVAGPQGGKREVLVATRI